MRKTTYYRMNVLMLFISVSMFICLYSHHLLYCDDMATLLVMRMPFGEMLRFLFTEDVHLPVYFILLKVWMFFFGDSVYIARCFSYAGLLACAFGCGYMVKRLYGERAGLWYTALFLFLPASFWLIKTIRMYSWACFFCTAVFWQAQAALTTGKRKDFVLYVFFSFLGAWTHYYASLTCAIIACVFLVLSWKKDRAAFKKFFIADAVLFLGVCPQIYVFLHQNPEEVNWITDEYLFSAWVAFFEAYKGKPLFPMFVMTALWVLGLRFLLDGRKSAEKEIAKNGFLTALTFFALLFAVSLIVKPCLGARYVIITFGCLYAFFVFGFLNDRGGKLLVGVLIFFSCFAEIQSAKNENMSAQPFAFQGIQKNIRPDDVVVAVDWQILCWLYYHFPDYDIRVIKGREPTVFKKKHRLIDGEREMSDILSGKKVFLVSNGKIEDMNFKNVFDYYDPYMNIKFTLSEWKKL